MDEFEMINEDLLQDFTHEILNKYSAFCQKEGITPSFFHLISFLVKTDVVKEKTVAKYMVMQLYPNSLYSNDSKMDAMMEISIRTGISKKHDHIFCNRLFLYHVCFNEEGNKMKKTGHNAFLLAKCTVFIQDFMRKIL